MKRVGQSLAKIVEQTSLLKQVYKKDLQFGDLVLVKTYNSTYTVRVLDDGFYSVSGGWFDTQGLSPMKLKIAGCTWGGAALLN